MVTASTQAVTIPLKYLKAASFLVATVLFV